MQNLKPNHNLCDMVQKVRDDLTDIERILAIKVPIKEAIRLKGLVNPNADRDGEEPAIMNDFFELRRVVREMKSIIDEAYSDGKKMIEIAKRQEN